MRVLINGVSAVAGGGLSYLRNLWEMLPQHAPHDEFIVAGPPGIIPTASPGNTSMQWRMIPAASAGPLRRLAWENTELADLCRRERVDLLYCPANLIPLHPVGVPVVVMIQNVAPVTPGVIARQWHQEGSRPAVRLLAMRGLTIHALRHARQVIVLSEATRRLTARWIGGNPALVLYHGIDGRFTPDSPRPAGAPANPFFLYVSNHYVYKGVEYLVDALAHDRNLPPVILLGKTFDHGYWRWVQDRARHKGVLDRFIVRDHVPYEDLPGWYAHALGMVYTSWCENCPFILLEAMACGCPVVCWDTGPMPEICGDAAELAAFPAPDHLARSMRALLNPAHRTALSKSALHRARRFTWEDAIARHLVAFRQALGREAGCPTRMY